MSVLPLRFVSLYPQTALKDPISVIFIVLIFPSTVGSVSTEAQVRLLLYGYSILERAAFGISVKMCPLCVHRTVDIYTLNRR